MLSPWQSQKALRKCGFREEIENNHPFLSLSVIFHSFFFFSICLLNQFKRILVSLPLALPFLSPNHISGIRSFPLSYFVINLIYFSLRNQILRMPAGISWHSFIGATEALPTSSRQGSGSKILAVSASLIPSLCRGLSMQTEKFRALFRCTGGTDNLRGFLTSQGL